ncbi:MAG: mechanosensitive ion channel family protein [Gemmatimonadota bacterium]
MSFLLLTQAGAADAGNGLASLFLLIEDAGAFIRAGLLLLLGIPLLIGAARWTRTRVAARYTAQQGMVASKALLYSGLLLIVVSVLHQLEFSLTPLLGAAGIVGIAVGFASQTSVSNVISGFFLIGERPFEVDDLIQVGDTVGRVTSIDTLSIKLRTFDHRFVRIPNETIVKSQVTTITRFPIRRLDLNIGVAYKEDVGRVREILLDVANRNPRSLMEPAPLVFFDAYGDSALQLRLAVWATREQFIALKNSLLEEIKARFDAEGVEIPFPHRTFYTGAESSPLPIRIIAEDEPLSEPGSGSGEIGDEDGPDPTVLAPDPANDQAKERP